MASPMAIQTPGGSGNNCVGRVVDRLIPRQPLRRAAHDPHHPQRDDERHHAESRDYRAVDQTDHAAAQDDQRHRGRRRIASHQQRRSQHAGQGHDRPDAQIDPPADDDHRHPQRADGHDHGLNEDDLEIAPGEQIGTDIRAERKKAQHQQQTEKRPDQIQKVP